MASAISVSSCTLLNSIGSVDLAKRDRNHDNLELYKQATQPLLLAQVDLNSFIVQDPETPKLKYNVLSLSREGQAQYIKSLETEFPDPKDFIKQVNANFTFLKEEDPATKIIPKSIKKSLVFTVDRLQYHQDGKVSTYNLEGDRISYLQLSVNIPAEQHAKFNSWDKYITDHAILNLGKVSSTQQWSASVNLAAQATAQSVLSGSSTKETGDSTTQSVVLAPAADPLSTQTNGSSNASSNTGVNGNSLTTGGQVGGSANLAYSNTYNTAQDLTTRILKLEGDMGTKQIILRQEGGQGIDLSGNINVVLSYEITDDWAQPVYFIKYKNFYKGDDIVEFDKLKFSYLTVIYPDIKQDITGTLDYSFLYRQVNKGNRYISEARQKITFLFGTVMNNENTVLHMQPVVLIRKEDIRPKGYQLYEGVHAVTAKGIQPLFENTSDAAEFIHYLSDLLLLHPNVNSILVNGHAFTQADLVNTQIKTIQL